MVSSAYSESSNVTGVTPGVIFLCRDVFENVMSGVPERKIQNVAVSLKCSNFFVKTDLLCWSKNGMLRYVRCDFSLSRCL